MTIRTLWVSLMLACGGLLAAAGCEIHNCEEGSTCGDDVDDSDSRTRECTSYCGRLSVCGAAQALDFGRCIDSCRDRYSRLPEETHKLCACAESSSCADVTEGRCSDPSGSGGSCNACGSGGTPGNGGAQTYGGSAAGGASNASGGASSSGTGGSVSSGTGGGSNETGGASTGSCQAACDCPANYNCVSGHCVAI
ncbi:MAG: hypothetical protein QM756_40140 [Polyangiaceae bacterium]